MSDDKSGSGDQHKLLKQAISAFVSVTHIITFFQIVICSRHLAVAFNIPPKNIGIYFAKLYSLRSVLMSMACGIEYGIFRSTGSNDVRKCLSIFWLILLTGCEVSFLCVLYFSKSVAFQNYIVLNLEGMFFGFFQMSILSLIPEFATYYMLSLYVSGTSIFIIQTIIDRFTKNSMISVKIQAWICVFCSIESVALWIYYIIKLYNDPTKNTGSSGTSATPSNGAASNGSSNSDSQSTTSTCGSKSIQKRSADGFDVHPSVHRDQYNGSKMDYLMSMSSLTILKTMIYEFDRLCTCTNNRQQITNVKFLIDVLEQITSEDEICVRLFIRIDFVIVGLKEICCLENETTLLEQLVFVLRGKYILSMSKCKDQLTQHLSLLEPEPQIHESTGECSEPGTVRRRQRRNAPEQTQSSKQFHEHLFSSLSPLMFGTGSLLKDFLFPGVIPYGLLERDKCHLINLIVIIFLSIGPVTIFLIDQFFEDFKKHVKYYHWFWPCMVPKIVILIISLCAIHTKQGCTHQIRSSRWRVFLMTMILLTCYGFLETMSFVGMAFYVKIISGCPSDTVDLQAIHNVSGKFFRYFVYKFSVGYNKTRISAGLTLPNFKPPEPIGDNFCYWFKGTLSNGWKDLKSDFKFNIKQYLEIAPTPSKKSPIETLRYCDIFM